MLPKLIFKIYVVLSTFSVIVSAAPSSPVTPSDVVSEMNPSVGSHALAPNSLNLRSNSFHENLKTSRDIAPMDHLLFKRAFLTSPEMKRKFVVVSTALISSIWWGMTIKMVENWDGSVNVNSKLNVKDSFPNVKPNDLTEQYTDFYGDTVGEVERDVQYVLKAVYAGKDAVVTFTARLAASATTTSVVRMVVPPVLKIGGVVKQIQSWSFDTYP